MIDFKFFAHCYISIRIVCVVTMLQKCYLARKHNILTSQGKYMYPLKNLSLEQLEARLLNVLTKAHASLQEVEFSLDSTKTLQFNLTVS